MFYPGSRYEKTGTYIFIKPDGSKLVVAKPSTPSSAAVLGFHRRLDGQRLDLIANFYLKDATAFWRLCDANQTLSPDALAARALVGIPPQGK